MSVAVQLVWTPRSRSSAVSTTAYTDRKGNLSSRFSIPASPAGSYHIEVDVNGVAYASTLYRVRSHAGMVVALAPGAGGETIKVRGKHFLPYLTLLLVAYPMFTGAKAILLGRTRSDSVGRVRFTTTISAFRAGQYDLRAWSSNGLAAQMADAFFEVVV